MHEEAFGYTSGPPPQIGEDARYQVAAGKVRLGLLLAEDEVDLESGFLMLPSAVPQPELEWIPIAAQGAQGRQIGETGPRGDESTAPDSTTVRPESGERIVEVSFSASRNQLFSAWNAIANLADMAGSVSVTVRAESAEGFDRSRLHNGVLEPLREADLIE